MISVIIPAYNRAKTIERSVNSVLKQTYTDIEVIVVDDCSTDNTAEIVSGLIKNDKRVRYYKLNKNSGACAARNKGIELSQGEYIAFQDSDDEWLPEKLEIQIENMKKNNTDICFCRYRKIRKQVEEILPKIEAGVVSRDVLLAESIVSTQTIIGKRYCFDEIRFDLSMPRLQDYDIVIRLSQRFLFYLVGEPLVNVYVQDDSLTMNPQKLKTAIQILEEKYQEDIVNNKRMKCFMIRSVARSNEFMGISSLRERIQCFALCPSKSNAKKIIKAIMIRLRLCSPR